MPARCTGRQCRLLTARVRTPFFHIIAPCPPFLSSTASSPTLRLQEWAEPGPSTPPRHAVAHAENWDDDFEGKSKSPAHQSPPRSHPNHKLPRLPDIPEPENWDDDLDANRAIKACHRHHDHHDHHLRRLGSHAYDIARVQPPCHRTFLYCTANTLISSPFSRTLSRRRSRVTVCDHVSVACLRRCVPLLHLAFRVYQPS